LTLGLLHQALRLQKTAHNIGHVSMLRVHRVIHLLHFRIRNLACEIFKDPFDFRVLLEHLLPNHGNRLIRRKVVAVILKNDKIERGNQSVRCIPARKVYLPLLQSSS